MAPWKAPHEGAAGAFKIAASYLNQVNGEARPMRLPWREFVLPPTILNAPATASRRFKELKKLYFVDVTNEKDQPFT